MVHRNTVLMKVCAVLLAAGLLVGCMPVQPVAPTAQPAAEAPDDVEAKIANARSAGPPSVSGNATIVDRPTADIPEFTELQAGTNGWYCIPDDPATPTNDPFCVDDQWLEWLTAFVQGREPEITRRCQHLVRYASGTGSSEAAGGMAI